MNHRQTELWSGQDAGAGRLAKLPQSSTFAQLGQQQDSYAPNAPNFQFTFDDLWPQIQASAAKYGADAQVVTAILYQESGFKNWLVHRDGTGHGLPGLDDNGLLSGFEHWSGQNFGRSHNASSIPPALQIEYLARTMASFARTYGNSFNAARVWHRGPTPWKDTRGQNYEDPIRTHINKFVP